MPYYYGIDLGTTNTVISCLRVFPRRAMIMAPSDRCTLEIVPIYYDKYSWDAVAGRYLDYDETIYRMQQGGFGLPDMHGAGGLSLEWPKILPSVVYQHFSSPNAEPTYLTGEPANKMYNQEHNTYPERFFENTKSLMDQDVVYEEGSLTAVDIAKQLLKTCFLSIMKYKEQNHREPAALGISYPAARNQMNYLKSLREAAVEAAHEVGLLGEEAAIDFFCTTQEPYAAMMSLILDDCKLLNAGGIDTQLIRKDSDECFNLMVVDIGGGTTDIAIQPVQMYRWKDAHLPIYPEECVRMNANQSEGVHSTYSAVNLNGDFGGSDFDYLLARKITRQLARQAEIDLDVDHMSPYVQTKALNLARAMKHGFSNDSARKEWRQNVTAFFGPLDHMHDSTLLVRKEDYENWIRPYIRNTVGFNDPNSDYKRMKQDDAVYSIERIIDNTMQQAGCVDWNDIDFVFLTGGMSKMPEIREMLHEKVRHTGCRIIFSDERQRVAVDNDADSPRFMDITYGVAVYACLTGGTDGGNSEVPNHGGNRFKDFTTSPHSSVALLADIGEGLPVVLINHSQALPVEDNVVPNVFISQGTAGIFAQMYTGLSAYDKGLKKLTRNFVSLEAHPPFGGTEISLIYSIGQDMHATLRVRYLDATGQLRIEPMKEVFLDSVNRSEE